MNEENLNRPDNGSDNSVAETVKQLCLKILSYFPLYSTPRVQAWQEEGKILLEIYGDKSGILIGKHGQTLSALEFILTRIIQHQTNSSIQLYIDCEGYRKRRKEMLEKIAKETAEEVSETLTPVNLGAMSSEERKIIHLALQNHPTVCTESRGIPPNREIIVKPRQKSGE